LLAATGRARRSIGRRTIDKLDNIAAVLPGIWGRARREGNVAWLQRYAWFSELVRALTDDTPTGKPDVQGARTWAQLWLATGDTPRHRPQKRTVSQGVPFIYLPSADTRPTRSEPHSASRNIRAEQALNQSNRAFGKRPDLHRNPKAAFDKPSLFPATAAEAQQYPPQSNKRWIIIQGRRCLG
jgi:hypothetical protein